MTSYRTEIGSMACRIPAVCDPHAPRTCTLMDDVIHKTTARLHGTTRFSTASSEYSDSNATVSQTYLPGNVQESFRFLGILKPTTSWT